MLARCRRYDPGFVAVAVSRLRQALREGKIDGTGAQVCGGNASKGYSGSEGVNDDDSVSAGRGYGSSCSVSSDDSGSAGRGYGSSGSGSDDESVSGSVGGVSFLQRAGGDGAAPPLDQILAASAGSSDLAVDSLSERQPVNEAGLIDSPISVHSGEFMASATLDASTWCEVVWACGVMTHRDDGLLLPLSLALAQKVNCRPLHAVLLSGRCLVCVSLCMLCR